MIRTMGTIRPYKVIEDKYESQESYTIDIDLPNKGRFSMMNLLVKARTLTTGVGCGPWVKHLISSVSINEGGQSHLNSAPPETFQSDAYYKTDKMHRSGYQIMGGAGTEIIESVPILFGEGMYDPNYGIDLAKMSDPQLSITYNTATQDIGSNTIWTSDYYPRFTPILYLQEGVWPALQGYQSLRQIDSYTPADSEEHKTELKGGRPIKRVYAQMDKSNAAYGWIHSLDKVKLWGDNEQYKPFEQGIVWWYEIIRDIYGLCEFSSYMQYGLQATGFDCVVGRPTSIDGKVQQDDHVLIIGFASGRNVRYDIKQISDGAETTSVWPFEMRMKGYTPWQHLVIDAERMLGVEWFDAAEHAPTYLELDHVSNANTIGGPVNIHVADKAVQV